MQRCCATKPKYFTDPAAFRRWLKLHHASAPQLLVGLYKINSGKPSISWPESVGEALCFGWIDGVRRRVDDDSYAIRFTRRRPGGIWSAVNIRRARALAARGRMAAAGPGGLQCAQAEPLRTVRLRATPEETGGTLRAAAGAKPRGARFLHQPASATSARPPGGS